MDTMCNKHEPYNTEIKRHFPLAISACRLHFGSERYKGKLELDLVLLAASYTCALKLDWHRGTPEFRILLLKISACAV